MKDFSIGIGWGLSTDVWGIYDTALRQGHDTRMQMDQLNAYHFGPK
jgi:hypothetical protein